MEHFGVKLIKRDKDFRLLREEFALINTKPSLPFFPALAKQNAYSDATGSSYNEEWCLVYRELCLRNFDLNMMYFSLLETTEFNLSLVTFLQKYEGFTPVTNLNDYAATEGYYIMVLDDYKQVYIGKTDDIKKRIMKHWSNSKPFDRTLFPMYAYDKSCFSIDFFRALDTTRIYAWKKKMTDRLEAELINNFPAQFCTNRIGGDISRGIEALATMKQRNLK